MGNPDACQNSSIVMLQFSAMGYNSKLAAIMLAYTTSSPIGFYLVGCAQTPWGYTVPLVTTAAM